MTAVQNLPEVQLSELLAGHAIVSPGHDCVVRNITCDSREVAVGDCFFALPGHQHHGLEFARQAAAQGAAAIVTETHDQQHALDIPVISVPGLRTLIGELSARFFRHPSDDVRIFAVTGTNGKTTVAHLAAQAFEALGDGCGYIGTLGAGRLGRLKETSNTTPDVTTLNRLLAEFRDDGLTLAALEASSHALYQGRLAALGLHTAIFTNLGHDHLDYHENLVAYGKSKLSLFTTGNLKAAVINVDDTFATKVRAAIPAAVDIWTCSSGSNAHPVRSDARVSAHNIETSQVGIAFEIRADGDLQRVNIPIIGRFNVDNLLATCAILLSAGYRFEDACRALECVEPVAGRMELCGTTNRGVRVFIDYAHTPDSVAAALQALRDLTPLSLSIVFGCGGNRDQSKRPLMGAAAALQADHIYVTTDNPRDENHRAIADAVVAGIADLTHTQVILDREQAIRSAIASGNAGDIVLIAGKGHEAYQEREGTRHHFSDREVALSVIAESCQ